MPRDETRDVATEVAEQRVTVARATAGVTLAIILPVAVALLVPGMAVAGIEGGPLLAILLPAAALHGVVLHGGWARRWSHRARHGLLTGTAVTGIVVVVAAWLVDPDQQIPSIAFLAPAYVVSSLVVPGRAHATLMVLTTPVALGLGAASGLLAGGGGWALVMATLVGLLSGVGATGLNRATVRAARAATEAEEQRRTAERTTEALRAVVAAAGAAAVAEPDRVLEAITAAVDHLRVDIGVLYVLEDDGTVRLTAGYRLLPEHLHADVPPDQGVVGEVLRSGQPVVVDDYQAWELAIATTSSHDLASAAGVPIRVDGALAGLLVVGRYRPGDFPRTTLVALELLADHAGRALSLSNEIGEDRRTLVRLQRLHERQEDFVATVSHELRTPLAVVHGLAETLEHHAGRIDDAQRDELVARLRANTDSLRSIVGSLMDSAALDRGLLDPASDVVAIGRLVTEIVDRMTPMLGDHRVELAVRSARDVVADRALVERVVENLLTNLVRHTPQGTTARLTVEDSGRVVVVTLADDGPGIPAEELPSLTDRFTRGGATTTRETRGLGIGLALVDRVLRLHGSRLDVSSPAGQGATFRFGLRAAEDHDEAHERATEPFVASHDAHE